MSDFRDTINFWNTRGIVNPDTSAILSRIAYKIKNKKIQGTKNRGEIYRRSARERNVIREEREIFTYDDFAAFVRRTLCNICTRNTPPQCLCEVTLHNIFVKITVPYRCEDCRTMLARRFFRSVFAEANP